ncbi:hypothetical protein KUL72_20875 [Bradyrhizobium arachidis]|uniref:hypothetical protein n=1 Tax=Bradyrhizobium arachidis TaxID=858423 RepID=UPI0021619026|nr:hypothetical protein [Bradyrhizobium arachidis]UVO33968.1 hypothetical protein KUL72_20875 [Bradyrhizobium arachidis]
MIGNHQPTTKAKIGKGVDASAWRRKTKDKSNTMQSTAGTWEEDYASPSKQWKGRAMLWEEYTHCMDYDR